MAPRYAARPCQNGEIRLKRAYETFNNDARNDWLEQLQQKIRQGLNPPDEPGPSRSPSPFQSAETAGAIQVVIGEAQLDQGVVQQELDAELEEAVSGDDGEMEYDDGYGNENGPLAQGDEMDDELFGESEEYGALPRASQVPPTALPAAFALDDVASYPLSDETIQILQGTSNAMEYADAPLPPLFAFQEDIIDPDLLTSLAQQLDSGSSGQQTENVQGAHVGEDVWSGFYGEEEQGSYTQPFPQDVYAGGNGWEEYDRDQSAGVMADNDGRDQYLSEDMEQPQQDSDGPDGQAEYSREYLPQEQYVEDDDRYRRDDDDDRREEYRDDRDDYDEVRERVYGEQDELVEDDEDEDGDFPLDEYSQDHEVDSDVGARGGRLPPRARDGSSARVAARRERISLAEDDDELLDDETEGSYDNGEEGQAGDEDDELLEEEDEEEEEEDLPPRSQATHLMRRTTKPEVIEVLSDSDEEASEGEEGEEQTDEDEEEEEEEDEEDVEGGQRTARRPFPPRPTIPASSSPASSSSSRESPEANAGAEETMDDSDTPRSEASQSRSAGPQPGDEEEDELASRSPTPELTGISNMTGTPAQPIEFDSDSEADEHEDSAPEADITRAQTSEYDEEDDDEMEQDQADKGSERDEVDELESDSESDVQQQGSAQQHVYFDDEDELLEDFPLDAQEDIGEAMVTEQSTSNPTPLAQAMEAIDTNAPSPHLLPTLPPTDPSTAPLSPSSPVTGIEHIRASPVKSLLSIPTADEEEEQLEEMTVDVDESKHQPILLGDTEMREMSSTVDEGKDLQNEVASSIVEDVVEMTSQPSLVSLPNPEEEDQISEAMTVDDGVKHRPIMADEQEAEDVPVLTERHDVEPVAHESSDSSRTIRAGSHHHRPSPAPLISVPTAEEEDQLLDDMSGRENTHQPIMIDDEADIPMPYAPEEKAEEAPLEAIQQPEQPEEDTLKRIDAEDPNPAEATPVNMGFADYILQPPAHPEPLSDPVEPSQSPSPVPMSLIDNLPAEMSDDHDYRDSTPTILPDPSAPIPDTDVPSVIEAGDMPIQTSRSPSMEAVAPTIPPPADMTVDTIQRPESPVELPDPRAPPPDTSLPAPILPQDLEADDHTPTASVIAEAAEETPILAEATGTTSISPQTTSRSREETPTGLPDPKLAPEDARLPMPDVPHLDDAEHSAPASLIVNVAPVDEQTTLTPITPSGASPPRLIIRDFAALVPPPLFAAAPSGSQLLAVAGTGDLSFLTPASEMEVELAVADEETPAENEIAVQVEITRDVQADPAEGQDIHEEEEGPGVEEESEDIVVDEQKDVDEGTIEDGQEQGAIAADVAEPIEEDVTGTTPEIIAEGMAEEVMEEGEIEDDDEDTPGKDMGAASPLETCPTPVVGEESPDLVLEDVLEGEEGEVKEVPGSPAKEPSPDHEPLRHHHRGSVTPTPDDPIPGPVTFAKRQTRRQYRASLSTTETAVTRSHCGYRKLRIVENDIAANVLVPQCVLGDTDRMAQEESADLGAPSAEEEKEARTQRITHHNPLLNAGLAAKLHRVAGASIFDDGHCFLLSTSPGGRASDEDKQKTPQGTPRRISKGRQSRTAATPSIVFDIASSPGEGGASMKRQTSRSSRRSMSQLSDVAASPAPSSSSIGPRRSIRHARSGSRLSQISSERDTTPVPSSSAQAAASPAMNTRARSVQPLGPSDSSTSLDQDRDTTPVPADYASSAGSARRHSARLSLSADPEPVPIELATSSLPAELDNDIAAEASASISTPGKSTRGKGKAKAASPASSSLGELTESELPVSIAKSRAKRTPTQAPRKSTARDKDGEMSYRPSTPEMAAEDTDDAEETEGGPSRLVEGNESADSPAATGTRKRSNRLSMLAASGSQVQPQETEVPSAAALKRETRSGKRKAEADDGQPDEVEGIEGSQGGRVEKEKNVKKKRKGWKSFLPF